MDLPEEERTTSDTSHAVPHIATDWTPEASLPGAHPFDMPGSQLGGGPSPYGLRINVATTPNATEEARMAVQRRYESMSARLQLEPLQLPTFLPLDAPIESIPSPALADDLHGLDQEALKSLCSDALGDYVPSPPSFSFSTPTELSLKEGASGGASSEASKQAILDESFASIDGLFWKAAAAVGQSPLFVLAQYLLEMHRDCELFQEFFKEQFCPDVDMKLATSQPSASHVTLPKARPSSKQAFTPSAVSVTPPPITSLEPKDSDHSSDEQGDEAHVSVDKQRVFCKEELLELLATTGAPVETKGRTQQMMLPWTTMPGHLMGASLVIHGWPHGVPFPGEATAKTAQQKQAQGIKSLTTKETHILLKALKGDVDAKPVIRKAANPERVRQSLDPIMMGTTPTLGSEDKHPQCFYLDGVVVADGSFTRSSTTQATKGAAQGRSSVPRQQRPHAGKSSKIVASSDESDEGEDEGDQIVDSSPVCPIHPLSKRGDTSSHIQPPRRAGTRPLCMSDSESEVEVVKEGVRIKTEPPEMKAGSTSDHRAGAGKASVKTTGKVIEIDSDWKGITGTGRPGGMTLSAVLAKEKRRGKGGPAVHWKPTSSGLVPVVVIPAKPSPASIRARGLSVASDGSRTASNPTAGPRLILCGLSNPLPVKPRAPSVSFDMPPASSEDPTAPL